MAIAINPLKLDFDQSAKLEIMLMDLVDEGTITNDQADRISAVLFGIFESPEEKEYERRNVSQSEHMRTTCTKTRTD